jgi:hypothetical protein
VKKEITLFALLAVLLPAGFGASPCRGQAVDSLQADLDRGVTLPLNREGTTAVRFAFLNQFWLRHTELNRGSLYRGQPARQVTDFAIRRLFLACGIQVRSRLMLLVSAVGAGTVGEAPRQPQFNLDLLDAYVEYKLSDALYLGAGLPPWVGLSRITGEGGNNIRPLDLPQFQYPLQGSLERLPRSPGLYAKGRVARLNYRVMVNDPFSPVPNASPADAGAGSTAGGRVGEAAGNARPGVAYLDPAARSKLVQGYGQWEFLDKEPNLFSWEAGSYQGTRRVLNLGAGFMYRPRAILTPTAIGVAQPDQPGGPGNPPVIQSAERSALQAFAVDAFLDYRLSAQNEGVAAYLGYFHTDLGPNYYRVAGTNNPSTRGMNFSPVNGPGNAFPATGTGQTLYCQAGYLTPRGLWRGNPGWQWEPYLTYQHSRFEALGDPCRVYEGGVNWYLYRNGLKVTGHYRSRPVYDLPAGRETSGAVVTERKGELILQFQFFM